MELLGYDEWMMVFAAGSFLAGAVQVLLMMIRRRRNRCKRDWEHNDDNVVGTEKEPQHDGKADQHNNKKCLLLIAAGMLLLTSLNTFAPDMAGNSHPTIAVSLPGAGAGGGGSPA